MNEKKDAKPYAGQIIIDDSVKLEYIGLEELMKKELMKMLKERGGADG